MLYITVNQLNEDVKKYLLPQIPEDVGLVVAVPRDGLLPATLISLYQNIPMTDLDGVLEGRIYHTGYRLRDRPEYQRDIEAILIVDDTIYSGGTFRRAKKQLANIGIKFYFAVVFAVNPHKHRANGILDFWAREIPPALFHYEWTIGDAPLVSKRVAIDLDGILCPSPKPEQDDQGEKYLDFITHTPAKLKPIRVGTIITGRLERWRPETEAWLKRHGIGYDELIMRSANEPNHARHKAINFKKMNGIVFFESSDAQAQEIARLSRKPVIAMDTNKVYGD